MAPVPKTTHADRTVPGSRSFGEDVVASLAAWKRVPFLPITSALFAVITISNASLVFGRQADLIALPVGFMAFGWMGTQLVWYRQAFDLERVAPASFIPLTWSFLARFVWFYGILLFLPLLAVVWVTLARKTFGSQPNGYTIGLLAYVVVAQMITAFVPQALAFSTRRVSQALRIGLALLTRAWPGNAMYVVAPALVAGVYGSAYWLLPAQGRPIYPIASELLSLLFAGAIARFYLRAQSAS